MVDRHVIPALKGLEADALKTVTRDDDLEVHSATIDFSNGSEDPASAILSPLTLVRRGFASQVSDTSSHLGPSFVTNMGWKTGTNMRTGTHDSLLTGDRKAYLWCNTDQ